MTGGAVGSVAHLFSRVTRRTRRLRPGGDGNRLAGIVRTPMTSVIMIFEMTRDYTIIVPLMISNMIAYLISWQFQREPIYEALARSGWRPSSIGAGVAARSGRSPRRSADAPRSLHSFSEMEVAEAAVEARKQDLEACPVADAEGLWGMVPKWELESTIARGGSTRKLADLLGGHGAPDSEGAAKLPHVHPDHAVGVALERMSTSGYNVLPVVSRTNVRNLEGVVILDDILEAYRVRPHNGAVVSAEAET